MPDPMPIESEGQSLRCRRVAEALKQIIGRVITQELSDPRTGFVTVTRVKVTADLRDARVFVTVLGGQGDRGKALAALKHAAGYIKRRCGDELDLRFTPILQFEFDEGVDRSIRVSELLYADSHEPPAEKLPPLEEGPPGEDAPPGENAPAGEAPGA